MSDFTYFDQFLDTEINLNPYLDSVKEENGYDYKLNNIQSTKVTLKNIFDKISLVYDTKDISNFDPHVIGEAERIEYIADKKYGNLNYWWVIAAINNIRNLFTDWPLTQSQLTILSERLYTTEGLYNQQTYYDILFQQNEQKRNIILPKNMYIENIVVKFREVFQKSL